MRTHCATPGFGAPGLPDIRTLPELVSQGLAGKALARTSMAPELETGLLARTGWATPPQSFAPTSSHSTDHHGRSTLIVHGPLPIHATCRMTIRR